jgi:hypothetical protein
VGPVATRHALLADNRRSLERIGGSIRVLTQANGVDGCYDRMSVIHHLQVVVELQEVESCWSRSLIGLGC